MKEDRQPGSPKLGEGIAALSNVQQPPRKNGSSPSVSARNPSARTSIRNALSPWYSMLVRMGTDRGEDGVLQPDFFELPGAELLRDAPRGQKGHALSFKGILQQVHPVVGDRPTCGTVSSSPLERGHPRDNAVRSSVGERYLARHVGHFLGTTVLVEVARGSHHDKTWECNFFATK